jgi:hypothetical protein
MARPFADQTRTILMDCLLLALAGPAEAALDFTRLLMYSGLAIISIVAMSAAGLRSRKLSLATIVLVAAFCLLFTPWYCFAPFPAEAYDDADVVYHAAAFRILGFAWIATCVLVAVCLGLANTRGRRRPSDFSAARPAGPTA